MSKIDARFVDGASFAPIYDNAEAHNRILRNTKLTLNSDLFTNVKNGSFEGIYPGCYFEFEDVPYTYNGQSYTYTGIIDVADLNYFRRVRASDVIGNYLLVVPRDYLYDAKMNNSQSWAGGYPGSLMANKNIGQAREIFKACFGANHVIPHCLWLPCSSSNGQDVSLNAFGYFNFTVALLGEIMVSGAYSFSTLKDVIDDPYKDAGADAQLSLFRLNPERMGTLTLNTDNGTESAYWCRDVRNDSSAQGFVATWKKTDADAEVATARADSLLGVRPYALIG